MTPICDYAGYDYKKEFWEKVNRLYEDQCERKTLVKLIKKTSPPVQTLMDAGCGFGRLFDTYEPYSKNFILLDYAEHLLEQAMQTHKNENIRFIQGNLLDLPLKPETVDLILTVRTLHHLQNPLQFFKEVNRVLTKEGYFIFEIPNKRHALNILRFITGKTAHNPWSKTPLVLKETFLNYHPDTLYTLLKSAGFKKVHSLNTSFFRSSFLKKHLPTSFLVSLDLLFQSLFSWTNLTPSIYVLAQKI